MNVHQCLSDADASGRTKKSAVCRLTYNSSQTKRDRPQSINCHSRPIKMRHSTWRPDIRIRSAFHVAADQIKFPRRVTVILIVSDVFCSLLATIQVRLFYWMQLPHRDDGDVDTISSFVVIIEYLYRTFRQLPKPQLREPPFSIVLLQTKYVRNALHCKSRRQTLDKPKIV
jgi:hypothetical protein